MAKRVFTDQERTSMRELREVFGMTYEQIGNRFGVSEHLAHCAIDPKYEAHYRARMKAFDATRKGRSRKAYSVRNDTTVVPQSVAENRWKLLNAPYRSLADEILGCPRLGFSALDQRNPAPAGSAGNSTWSLPEHSSVVIRIAIPSICNKVDG